MSLRTFLLVMCFVLVPCGANDGGGYEITPIGAKTVYAGYQAVLPFWIAYQPGASTGQFFYEEVTGVPPGVSVEILCWPCVGSPPRQYNPPFPADRAIRVSASREAVPGDYVLKLRTRDLEGRSRTSPLPLTVLPEPHLAATPAVHFPPIPNLEQWRQKMETEGRRFCNAENKNQTFSFGLEASVWYYDGARIFYQIYDQTGDAIWRECAENVASQYAEYVTSNKGWIPGWRVFSRGLRMAYERTRNEKYRTALEDLASNGIYTTRPGALNDSIIRETAYIANTFIDAKLIGSPNFESAYAPKLAIVIDQLLAMYEVLFDSGTYVIHQPFYDGLAAEALIGYYESVAPDPRIPMAIKKMLDWTWNVGWDDTVKQLAYLPDQVPWAGTTELIGLSLPAFAWYYKLTGDARYLERGDMMFGHLFDIPFWSGKQFSQCFRWTFDYVKWRSPSSTLPAAERTNSSRSAEAPSRRALVENTPRLSVILSSRRIPGGLTFNNRVVVRETELPNGTSIHLESDRPDLVRFFDLDGREVNSITITKARRQSEYFYLDAAYAKEPTAVTVTATAGALSGQATVTVDPPASRVLVQNGIMMVGRFRTCLNQVVIDGPAPAGGMPVTVWTNSQEYLPAPVTVTVPNNSISAFFCVTPGARPSGETVLHALYQGGRYSRRSVLGATRTLRFTGLQTTLRSGASLNATVGFDGWIPVATEVAITSSNPLVQVPSKVVIDRAANTSVSVSKPFAINVGSVPAAGVITIRALADTGHETTAQINITP